ncbi:hypothetical protein ACFSUS_02350 [Spirosoma soli]|uniref:Uncharacterized protein n=1 Tax=Spirosoma soli TaxID=1770529 RepID=A0ABW5LZI4_9BACT
MNITEYALNRLTTPQLARFASSHATLLANVERPTFKLALYHLEGHFVEIGYCAKKQADSPSWELYSANHFPDTPANTKYLNIYLKQIELGAH